MWFIVPWMYSCQFGLTFGRKSLLNELSLVLVLADPSAFAEAAAAAFVADVSSFFTTGSALLSILGGAGGGGGGALGVSCALKKVCNWFYYKHKTADGLHHPSIHPSIYPSIHLSIYLSIFLNY